MRNRFDSSFKLAATTLAVAAMLAACGGGGDASGPADLTPPTVAITDNVSADTATTDVTFTFTFSEAVGSSFVAEDVVVTGGTAGTLTKVSDTVYTMVVTPTANSSGTINVSVAASAFTDIAGNNNTASASASQAFDTTTPPSPVANLLTNGDFQAGTTGWVLNTTGPNDPDVRTEGNNSYFFADVASAGAAYSVNLTYGNLNITAGTCYKVSFKASTSSERGSRALNVGIGLNADPWTNTQRAVTISATQQTFEFPLTANFDNPNPTSRLFFEMGHDTGIVVIDDVVLAVDEAGCASPTEASSTPAATLVASAYSDANGYAPTATWNYRTSWSDADLSTVTIAGNNILKYSNLEFVGIQPVNGDADAPIDASSATHINLDVWTPNINTLKIKLVDFGVNGTYEPTLDNTEHEISVDLSSNQSQWYRIRIPLTQFTGLTARNHLAQMILSTGGIGGTIFVDNIYFSSN